LSYGPARHSLPRFGRCVNIRLAGGAFQLLGEL